MARQISMNTRAELIRQLRERYAMSSRVEKRQILDEFCSVSGYHRKHAIRVLSARTEEAAPRRVVRRVYDEAVRQALIVLWEAADRICSKRLQASLPSLLEAMERHGHLALVPDIRERLLVVSPATIDRLLAPVRLEAGTRRRRGRQRSEVLRNIPVRTHADWKDPEPGYCEADFVLHCGGSTAGSFVHSFVVTDVATTWTDFVALVARDQTLLIEALDRLRERLPMGLRGLDTDNDSAFINEVVAGYCKSQGIAQTHSRARRSNDQAWIEQKNGAVIRKLTGHERFTGIAGATILAQLYRAARLYVNHFQPSTKLIAKSRDGGRVRKKYDRPKTPYERVLDHPAIHIDVKESLTRAHLQLDPVDLLREIRGAQRKLMELVAPTRQVGVEEQTVEDFLAQLPTLWHDGEVRATHRAAAKAPRTWRTRADPFADVWDEITQWLDQEPDLQAKAALERLQAAHPGKFTTGQTRTLQRRVQHWRATIASQLVGLVAQTATGEKAP